MVGKRRPKADSFILVGYDNQKKSPPEANGSLPILSPGLYYVESSGPKEILVEMSFGKSIFSWGIRKKHQSIVDNYREVPLTELVSVAKHLAWAKHSGPGCSSQEYFCIQEYLDPRKIPINWDPHSFLRVAFVLDRGDNLFEYLLLTESLGFGNPPLSLLEFHSEKERSLQGIDLLHHRSDGKPQTFSCRKTYSKIFGGVLVPKERQDEVKSALVPFNSTHRVEHVITKVVETLGLLSEEV